MKIKLALDCAKVHHRDRSFPKQHSGTFTVIGHFSYSNSGSDCNRAGCACVGHQCNSVVALSVHQDIASNVDMDIPPGYNSPVPGVQWIVEFTEKGGICLIRARRNYNNAVAARVRGCGHCSNRLVNDETGFSLRAATAEVAFAADANSGSNVIRSGLGIRSNNRGDSRRPVSASVDLRSRINFVDNSRTRLMVSMPDMNPIVARKIIILPEYIPCMVSAYVSGSQCLDCIGNPNSIFESVGKLVLKPRHGADTCSNPIVGAVERGLPGCI